MEANETLQQLREEAMKEFDFEFEDNGVIQTYIRRNGGKRTNATSEELKDFIDSLITKAYEEGKKGAEEDFEGIPQMEGTMEALNNLTIIKNKEVTK